MIARIDPSWIMIVKTPPGSSKPSNRLAISRCAVEETGRNSVTPCRTPRTAAFKRDDMSKSEVRGLKSDGADRPGLQTSYFRLHTFERQEARAFRCGFCF